MPPKTYMNEIIKNGGYGMLFETLVFPFGFRELVEEIKREILLPVDCPSSIPEGIILRFLRWHRKIVSNM